MEVKRHFSVPGKPFLGVNFETRVALIKEATGKVIFQGPATVPDFWSQTATDILAQKYFRRAGLPSGTVKVAEENVPEDLYKSVGMFDDTVKKGEEDARQTFHRLAGCWAYWGSKYGYFNTPEDSLAFYDDVQYTLCHQMAAPNSPQWFNTGLNWAYGIEGPPQGHAYVDPVDGVLKKSTSAYERPQPHACFILNVEDNLVNPNGLMDLWLKEARIFKYGSGVGSNFSKIRGVGEPLSGGGKSSGLQSFLRVGDRSAGAIKSGGTTRRAAKMLILDDDHPDILQFINWKVVEEQKVAALAVGTKLLNRCQKELVESIAKVSDDWKMEDCWDPKKNKFLAEVIARYLDLGVPAAFIKKNIQTGVQGQKLHEVEILDTGWTSEAYETVSGQNSNNTVRLSNSFIEAVKAGSPWNLYWRTELAAAEQQQRPPKPYQTLPARELWNTIVNAAWASADPGLQFHNTINEWHTCPAGGPIRASNPCSEYMFLDDTACNLASINLLRFYDPSSKKFDVEGFKHTVRLWTVILEISVLMAQFPSEQIATRSYEYRTLGLGYANLGAMLMQMGLPYDSDEGRAIAGAVTAIMQGQSMTTSAEMAKDLGPFARYSDNKEAITKVAFNHWRATNQDSKQDYVKLSIKPMEISKEKCPKYLLDAAQEITRQALEDGKKYGYRNAQWTVLAPTGTIAYVMDCDTTGVEPDYSLIKFKTLAGGGSLKIINQSVIPALDNLGYTPTQIQDIQDYCVGHGNLQTGQGFNIITTDDLRDAGLSGDEIDQVQEGLKGAFDVRHILPVRALTFFEKKLGKHFSNVLDRTNVYVCGTMTIEGAPHLKEEHYSIFDCANKCGSIGKRYIVPTGHVKMMAAAQPFLSGAISKTINMPSDATFEEVGDIYMMSHSLMIKAIALYRDSSKLSQPLNATVEFGLTSQPQEKPKEVVPEKTKIRKRNQLPTRRIGYTQKARVTGHTIYLHTGEYADGKLGEIFLNSSKAGAPFAGLLNSFAISISLGLQYGVPLEEYINAFVGSKFEPHGMVDGNPHIKMCTSLLDYIFRELGVTYLQRADLAHISKDELTADMTPQPDAVDHVTKRMQPLRRTTTLINITPDQPQDPVIQAKSLGYEGEPCNECGSWTLVRNGTCLKCSTCGSTNGCS